MSLGEKKEKEEGGKSTSIKFVSTNPAVNNVHGFHSTFPGTSNNQGKAVAASPDAPRMVRTSCSGREKRRRKKSDESEKSERVKRRVAGGRVTRVERSEGMVELEVGLGVVEGERRDWRSDEALEVEGRRVECWWCRCKSRSLRLFGIQRQRVRASESARSAVSSRKSVSGWLQWGMGEGDEMKLTSG